MKCGKANFLCILAMSGSNERMSLSDKAKLQYTEAVICEVTRIKPVGGIAIPHVTAEDVTIGDP